LYDDKNDDKMVVQSERIDFKKFSSNNQETDTSSSLASLPPNIYCDLVTTLNTKCKESSLLEIWKFREDLINTATQQEIIDAVNLLDISPWYGYQKDFSETLGGISRNSTGHIVAAKSEIMVFVNKVDYSHIDLEQMTGFDLEFADEINLNWESEFIAKGLSESTEEMKILMLTPRSFSDITKQTALFDAKFVVSGYSLMIIFTILVLGKISILEIRFYLTISGIVSIIMGMIIGIGVSSILGYPYTTINIMVPFICLGIGIDDMFVIVQSLTNISNNPDTAAHSLADKLGLTLKHAGVSITVTTITDVCAFGLGAFSNMPGLQAFCVCTAVSLAAIYSLQMTWFMAWLFLDQQRIQSQRNGLLPCLSLSENKSGSCTTLAWGSTFLHNYVKILPSLSFKIMVIITTTILAIIGVSGCILIKQKFDFLLLLPKTSYLRQWHDIRHQLYPDKGWVTDIYTDSFGASDLGTFENITNNLEELQKSGLYIQGYDSWWQEFKKYSIDKEGITNWKQLANVEVFPKLFSDFLFSSAGTKYRGNFKLNGSLICGEPAPEIMSSRLQIQYFPFSGPEEHIPAKKKIDDLIKQSGVPGGFSFVKVYASWETDEIISEEMKRNICLALTCITIISLVMLANFTICFMVFIVVILTLIDVIGFLHFWNITIDIFSASGAVLSIGLCVDYAVHLGLAFMINKGSRIEKSTGALSSIGPAIFNGGISTFLSVVLLSLSTSYIFISYFKVLFLTVLFGLFHGLVLLPVMLTMAGPVETNT